jgi:hypothetical protein
MFNVRLASFNLTESRRHNTLEYTVLGIDNTV